MSNLNSILVNTDSYKVSMAKQYPEDTVGVFSYIESRGGEYDTTLFFGLQMFIKEYLTKPFTQEQIDFAEKFYAAHGEPFNKAGWESMLAKYNGYLPIRIRALKEGTVLPVSNALCTIENTDPEFYWLTTWIETALLRAIWYPTTVATQSKSIKNLIKSYLEKTGDVNGLSFKLHDFGARGVSSLESAAIGGAAHLVNFMGSDTVSGVVALMEYYNAPVSGFSIPAAEHSTITSWTRDREVDAYRNMVKQFGREGSLLAVVSDSYDIFNACKLWGTELKDDIVKSGATVVVRPDSGDPANVVAGYEVTEVSDLDDYTLLDVKTPIVRVGCQYFKVKSYDTGWTTKFTITEIREEEALGVVRTLAKYFGYTVNDKGYNVLNNVRVIQGDGINETSINAILSRLTSFGWSADNVAFGMGGALLQIVNRDTLRFAMKCSAMKKSDGTWVDVYKDPITDSGKRSKRGRLTTIEKSGEFKTVRLEDALAYINNGWKDAMDEVFKNGKLLRDESLEDIRARSNM